MRSISDDSAKCFRTADQNRIGLLLVLFFIAIEITVFVPSRSLASAILNATSVSGHLTSTNGSSKLSLRIDPFSPPLEIEAHGSVQETLAHLSVGSWIVGRGEINRDQTSIRLVAIQTLGLREILGAWTGPKNEVFVFQTFNRLLRYKPMMIDGAVQLKLVQKLEYALSPDAGHAYSIFITNDKKQIFFGILRVDGTIEIGSAADSLSEPHRTLFLTMYDSQTGTEAQKFSLSPLLVK